jgi:hypothetical protein
VDDPQNGSDQRDVLEQHRRLKLRRLRIRSGGDGETGGQEGERGAVGPRPVGYGRGRKRVLSIW